MSPQAKVNLGAKAEAMLASWPAPTNDDATWENRAAKIVAAATNAPRASDSEIAALFQKPALDPEPGEVESSTVSAVSARSASGEKAMSDSNPGSPGTTSSPAAAPAPSAAAKRPSLKELAARASQANASGSPSMRPSGPASMPPPSMEAVSQDKQSRPASVPPAAIAPKPSVPPPRSLEAMKEDSGRVNLSALTQPAAPVVAAEPVKEAAAPAPVAEDKPAAEAEATEGAKVKNIADAKPKKTKKKAEAAKTNEVVKAAETAPVPETVKKAEPENDNSGARWVAIAALLAIAAVGFVFLRKKDPPPTPVATVVQEKPDTTPIVTAQQKIEEPKPASTGLSIDSLPTAAPTETAKPAAGPKVAAATVEAPPAPAPTPEPVAPTAIATATGGGKVGDLASEMAKSVGGSTDKPVNADDATPAAGKTGNQTIPEQPSQGAANAAIRPLAANAKSCVAGADDVSYASVTFSSAGTVSNVNVSGWAQKNGKADCIKAALKGANVGPFAKPSFTLSVPIRP
ncbi:MAG TPA: hypothetical protein PKA58_09235 [Polyangium sp.]|jgi:hypothetical protein|nr:hypothetical protein [Polyangium sp.]